MGLILSLSLLHFYSPFSAYVVVTTVDFRQTPTLWLWTANYVSWTEDVEQRDGLSADPECV